MFSKAVLQALVGRVRRDCPNLEAVLSGFPSPNQRLELPSASIYMSSFEFTPNITNYFLRRIQGEEDGTDKNLYAVGDWNGSIKLDLWAAYRESLDKNFEEVFKCLNPENTTGLYIEMEDYYNQAASYLMADFDDLSEESSSRENMWRFQFSIETTALAVNVKKDYVIRDTQVESTITKGEI